MNVVTPRPRPTPPQEPEPAANQPVVVAEAKPAQPEPAKPASPPADAPKRVEAPKPENTSQQPPKAAEDTGTDNNPDFKWDTAAAATTNQAETETKAATVPAKPAAEPKVAARTEPKPAAKKAVASKLRLPFVQAGVFGVKANANRLISKLKKRGYPAVGKTVRSKGRVLTRVLAGPFNSVAQRNRARAALRKMGLNDAVPVRR